MNSEQSNPLLIISAIVIFAIVLLGFAGNDPLLWIAGLITGVLVAALARRKGKIGVDEREAAVREKAARLTYIILAPVLGITALILLIPSRSGLSVFSRGNYAFLETMGLVFAFLTLFLTVVFAIAFYFIDQQYGGGRDEE